MPLTVTIISFSYKSALPFEDSPHGGGFVFDCRCLPNPGRMPAMANHTGRDAAVKDYLDNQPAVREFADRVDGLVQQAVHAYLHRDFSDLLVCFGCTGGRHRSVYFAEQQARRLKEISGVQVKVRHAGLEQNCGSCGGPAA